MRTLPACFCFAILCCSGACARDLFNVNAVTTDRLLRLSQTDGGSNLPNLLAEAIKAQGAFSEFQSRDYTSFLDYANVSRAIRFDVNSGGTVGTIAIPVTGFEKTFLANNRDDLYSQIKAFLLRDGASEWAKFLQAINERSSAAVTDGNPVSTTATLADSMFSGFESPSGRANEMAGKANLAGIAFDSGEFRSAGFNGQVYTLPIKGHFRITDCVALGFEIPLQYIRLAGAKIYQGGLTLNVPTKVIRASENQPWSWDVTPTVAFALSGSEDMIAGGGLFAGALTNVVGFRWHGLTFTYGNFFSFFEGVNLSVGRYEFDSNVSQQIMKNGLRVSVPFAQKWQFEGYAIHTKFLQTAAVDSYVTLGGDVGYRLVGRFYAHEVSFGYLSLGCYTELGNGFDALRFRIGSAWTF
jgi:hypothetical protein